MRFVFPLLLLSLPAVANEIDTCPLPPGASPALAAADPHERLIFLRARIHQSATHAAIYMGSWSGAYAVAAAAQFASIPTSTPGQQKDRIVGGSAAAFGMLFALIPPRILVEDGRLRRGPSLGLCADIARAEHSLVVSGREEKFNRSPIIHVGNFFFNIGLGLIIGLGFGHADVAAITAATGLVIGEIQFFTRPNTSRADMADYLNADFRPRRVSSRFQYWTAAPIVRPDGGGMLLALTY
jgi:hypothetical protein